MNSPTWTRLLLAASVMSVGFFTAGLVELRASGTGWSPPVMIIETDGDLANTAMALVSDNSGRLHLLFPHRPGGTNSTGIDYMVWEAGEWSEPVNVFIGPGESTVQNVRAVVDSNRMVHAVWRGANNGLYFSSAPTQRADTVHAWLTPLMLGESLPTEAGIAVAPDGAVWVAYADATQADTITLVELTVQGDAQSRAEHSVHAGVNIYPGEVSIAIDSLGRMHLTWTTLQIPESWPPTGVYYARSLDHGVTWETRIVAEGDYGQAGLAVPTSDEVQLFWSSTVGGDGTYHQWSPDGGQTWSAPERFMEQGGFSGLPTFGVDSAGNTHYLRGSGVYAVWDGRSLSPHQPITTDDVCLLGQISCGERAQLALTAGNRLHAVFETDFDRLWYTSKVLEVPELDSLAVSELPVEQLVGGQDVAPKASPSPRLDNSPATRQLPSSDLTRQTTGSVSQTTALWVAVSSAMILVLGVVLYVRIGKLRR